ncbi:hypothetical protein Tco_0939142 [Tanacetum coccineum]|uniref:Uncharacterized protein n=1 Tax=Tanacetum coccineum TaxID=301880 RepID=A0ABQ5DK16_9ASTR
MPKKKKKSQSMDKGKDKDKEDDTVNMFFKKMEFISVDHCVIFDWSKMSQGLDAFVEKLKLLKKEVEADLPNPLSKNKTDNLEQLVGVAKPPVVNVNNPSVGTTKGRQKLRIKGGKEKAIEKVLKGMNLCSMCGGYDNTMRESEDGLKVKRSCGSKEVLSQWEVGQLSIAADQVVDIHYPNEMVDIPDDIDLVDYDEEDPKEDPEEEPEEDVDINRGMKLE